MNTHWHPHFGEVKACRFEEWLASRPLAPPARRYILIASEERSGSEWLCQLMGATAVLGYPSEYFNAGWFRNFIPDYPKSPRQQVQVVQRASVTSNGVGATKLHAHQFDIIKDTVDVGTVFRPGVFVRLFRRDKLRQAISLVRARSTKRYHHHWPFNGQERYDAAEIHEAINELVGINARWTRYFARNGVEPVTLEYEALASNPMECLERIAEAVEVNTSNLASASVDRGLQPQRDELTEQWRARFLVEYADLNRFE